MSMIVIGSHTMACMDCGGFHFLADNRRVVTHEIGPMYQTFDALTRTQYPCRNDGKQFTFPDQPPVEGIKVNE